MTQPPGTPVRRVVSTVTLRHEWTSATALNARESMPIAWHTSRTISMCQHSEALWRSLLLRFRQLMVGWDASHPAGCRVAGGTQGPRAARSHLCRAGSCVAVVSYLGQCCCRTDAASSNAVGSASHSIWNTRAASESAVSSWATAQQRCRIIGPLS